MIIYGTITAVRPLLEPLTEAQAGSLHTAAAPALSTYSMTYVSITICLTLRAAAMACPLALRAQGAAALVAMQLSICVTTKRRKDLAK